MFKTLWYAIKTWYARKTKERNDTFLQAMLESEKVRKSHTLLWMLENAEAKRQDDVYKGKFTKNSQI